MNTSALSLSISARCLCPSCSSLLVTRQERKDGLCSSCADAPAVSDVHPSVIADWAIAKVHREESQSAN